LVLLGSWLIVALGVDALLVAFGDAFQLLAAGVRLALTVGLFYAVWIGHNWARWLTIGLFGFAFLMSVRHFIVHHNLLFLLFTLFFLRAFAAFTIVLTISKAVAAFLSYQRSVR
jgi:hypothetical protein